MAISVTTILGTDSLSGSRLVINDNFNVLASEINAMETYFTPSAGTITNLNNVSTEALRVGLNTILLDVSASTFDILTNVNMTGNLTMNGGGIFRNDTSPVTQNNTLAGAGMTLNIGTGTAIPPFTMWRVGNTNAATTLTLALNNGSIGQEIFFVYTEGIYKVTINGVANNVVLDPPASTNIDLTGIGQSVHLLAIDNGAGAAIWYVVGGQGYTIS